MRTILDSIGNTPLVELKKIVAKNSAKVFAKLEWANPTGSHRIEGTGIGFIPPLWELALVNELMTVSSHEAAAMARRLAREEGLFAGASSGANIVAALRVAQRLGPGATVATIFIDSGLRYLSTELYRDASPGPGG